MRDLSGADGSGLGTAAPRIGVVLNKASGGAIGTDPTPAIVGALQSRGAHPVVVEDSSGGIVEAIERALEAGITRLVVFGGDGTLAAAGAKLAGTSVELAVLAGGTMNVLAKDLGVPLELDAAVEVAVHGVPRSIDVGDVNGEVFLVSAFIGLPAQLQRHREAQRGKGWKYIGWLRLAWTAAAALYRSPSLRLEIDLGQGRRRVKTRALWITNNLVMGEGPDPLRKARLDAGELGFHIVRPMSPRRILQLCVDIMRGRIDGHPGLVRVVGDHFVVDAHRRHLRVMNDGETHLLPVPLTFTIRRRALRVLVPPE